MSEIRAASSTPLGKVMDVTVGEQNSSLRAHTRSPVSFTFRLQNSATLLMSCEHVVQTFFQNFIE